MHRFNILVVAVHPIKIGHRIDQKFCRRRSPTVHFREPIELWTDRGGLQRTKWKGVARSIDD